MDEQEKKKILDHWYAAFDHADEDLKVFADAEHEEKVRLRLLNSITDRIPGTNVRIFPLFQPYASWMKIAAVLAFLICSFSMYQYLKKSSSSTQTENTIQWSRSRAGQGKMLKVILADGSEITLNSGSEIRYPAQFNGPKRQVYLDGEAFFKVKHNETKPFVVSTAQLSTTVLGTSFNIRAYAKLNQIAVSVATGKVGVTTAGKTLAFLYPNQQINFEKNTGDFTTTEIPARLVSSWRDGVIKLDGASFSELALVIKNTWGLTLETKSNRLAAANFKTTFYTHNQITEVMKTISKMTDANYRIRDHIITLYE